MGVAAYLRQVVFAALVSAMMAVAAIMAAAPAVAQVSPPPAPGPEAEPKGALGEQLWWVPITGPGGGTFLLETTVYRPKGKGPFPLAVLNHGSPANPAKRRADPRTKWSEQSRWFVDQGFAVVIPMRRGYARSEGDWGENYGSCANPDYASAGSNGAWDILSVTNYFRAQPFVDRGRVLLVGQSAGGWGVTAASSQKLDGVFAIVNFAGGRGGRANALPCQAENLVYAAGIWGKTARLPILWIYTENDSLFPPAVSRRVAEAYKSGGAPMEYVLLPPFGKDGHALFHSRDGVPIWAPLVGKFLKTAGYDVKG